MKKFWFIIICLLSFIPFVNAKKVTINLFYSSTCPHCKAEKIFLDTLNDVEVKKYEVSAYPSLTQEVMNKLSIKESSVPITIVGSDYIIGYSDEIKDDILDMIDTYKKKNYCDVVDTIIDDGNLENCLLQNKDIYTRSENRKINFFGKTIKFNAKSVSLPLISLLIGFIDGFNPCAMWVLLFLISMLFNMKDRKKMWILGITFLVSSALIYLVFMLGILTIATFIGTIFKYIVAAIALIGGLLNLNSFRKSLKKDVGCEVTDKKKRNKIIEKIKTIIAEKNLLIAIVGIILLASSVNLIELACSSALPSIFVGILKINNLSAFEYGIYMLLYILMFMIDDIIIFVIAMTTLKVTGISNKYTKYSHLIGGILMVLIGLLMIFKMDWLMFNF